VLGQPGSSDTVTISLSDGRVTLVETGVDPVALHASATVVSELRFEHRGSAADGSEYVGFTLVMRSAQDGQSRASYDAATTLRSGAFLRNQGL